MRVEEMVRELVDSCSSVVHAVRLTAVVALAKGIIGAGRLSPATIGRSLSGRALHQSTASAGRPAAGQSQDGARPAVLLPGDRASPSNRLPPPGHYHRLDPGWGSTRCARSGRPDRRSSAADLHRGSSAEEARECGCREAIPVRPQGHHPHGVRSIIVSDAGFKGPFFQAVLDQGWDFLGRLRGRRKPFPPSERQSRSSSFTDVLRSLLSSSGRSVCFVKQTERPELDRRRSALRKTAPSRSSLRRRKWLSSSRE